MVRTKLSEVLERAPRGTEAISFVDRAGECIHGVPVPVNVEIENEVPERAWTVEFYTSEGEFLGRDWVNGHFVPIKTDETCEWHRVFRATRGDSDLARKWADSAVGACPKCYTTPCRCNPEQEDTKTYGQLVEAAPQGAARYEIYSGNKLMRAGEFEHVWHEGWRYVRACDFYGEVIRQNKYLPYGAEIIKYLDSKGGLLSIARAY